ncbi:MAG: DUF4260 domain-containing protein, partial [Pleurocapsa sp. SU_196_0]|nr:DUF4260 domain-containing protein [Pleurocapsa sp. SU_196_0]
MKTNNVSLRVSPSILTFLRLEGLLEFAVAIVLYAHLGGNGWVFAALVLTPDIAMLGYLRNPRVGAFTYNLAHTTTFPLALGIVAFLLGASSLVLLAFTAYFVLRARERPESAGLSLPDEVEPEPA